MKYFLTRFFFVAFAFAVLFNLQANAQSFMRQGTLKSAVESNVTKIGQTFYLLDNYYIDTLNFSSVTDKALLAIAKELDPHSIYIPAKDVQAMNEPLEGNFSGIGVEFAIIDDILTVQSVIQGGPSENVGIKAGDKIVMVDGEKISNTGLTIERVHKYLRGVEGSKVKVEILRKGEKGPLDFMITRAKIPLNSLDASYEIAPGVLYLKLSRFSATSYDEIMAAVKKYNHSKGIILDLRGNGGGYLITALQIANEFLRRGQLILYTEGRKVRRMNEYADGTGILQNAKLTVLIDENSASASEIVSGAIQDWDRGVIIGRRSFGKGLVQQLMPLSDGSQLRLTVARYHTPSGRVIQSPYKAGKAEEYYKAFYERFAKSGGGIFGADSIQLPDSLKYTTLISHRTVYGGGGIMPDIFIAQDTTFYTKYYGEILRKGIMVDFVNKYLDNNRSKLAKQYKHSGDPLSGVLRNNDYYSFVNGFKVDENLFSEFVAYTEEKGLKPSESDLLKSGDQLRRYLKALVLRGIFDFNLYIRYLNESDNDVIRAVKVI